MRSLAKHLPVSLHPVLLNPFNNEGLFFRHAGTVCHSPGSAIGGNDFSHQREKTNRRRWHFSRISGQIDEDNSSLRGKTSK
ncbi:hypothetical protein NPIL_387971 [Nephila pilipes]|uniref:Uncharacterized protein n=1 Tax=Nephila pilipes TaxID=299642 RepID=A0A8X6NF85_NEPPI|nr:hypothetical protein NPIL_387971 [Nephila pilipes]